MEEVRKIVRKVLRESIINEIIIVFNPNTITFIEKVR